MLLVLSLYNYEKICGIKVSSLEKKKKKSTNKSLYFEAYKNLLVVEGYRGNWSNMGGGGRLDQ
jgi:hypothetical protein